VRGRGAVDASAPPAVVGPTPCSTVAGAARLLGCSIAVKGSGIATSEIYPRAIFCETPTADSTVKAESGSVNPVGRNGHQIVADWTE